MPVQRQRPFRDEVTRISVRQLRESLGKSWKSASSVSLTVGDTVTVVEILDLPCAETYGGKKRFLRCPTCLRRRAMVLGHFAGQWGCSGCSRWAGRDKNRLLRERQRGGGTPVNQVNHEPAALPCRGDLAPSNQAIPETEPPCCP